MLLSSVTMQILQRWKQLQMLKMAVPLLLLPLLLLYLQVRQVGPGPALLVERLVTLQLADVANKRQRRHQVQVHTRANYRHPLRPPQLLQYLH